MNNLSLAERHELVTLDYVLTWNYAANYTQDLARYHELQAKRENNTGLA
jgi:hypothetical protein